MQCALHEGFHRVLNFVIRRCRNFQRRSRAFKYGYLAGCPSAWFRSFLGTLRIYFLSHCFDDGFRKFAGGRHTAQIAGDGFTGC